MAEQREVNGLCSHMVNPSLCSPQVSMSWSQSIDHIFRASRAGIRSQQPLVGSLWLLELAFLISGEVVLSLTCHQHIRILHDVIRLLTIVLSSLMR